MMDGEQLKAALMARVNEQRRMIIQFNDELAEIQQRQRLIERALLETVGQRREAEHILKMIGEADG